jgi:ABC-type antimicrobial peptide transport system permease subunit
MVKEYLIVFTVFGLFFAISMVGYTQTIRLQVYRNSYQIGVLQSLGMDKRFLKNAIVLQVLKVPLISSILGLVSIQSLKKFLEYKYTYWEINYHQNGEYSIETQVEYLLQQARYFTQYEMYKVSTLKVFLILVAVVVIFTWICTSKVAKQVVYSQYATLEKHF